MIDDRFATLADPDGAFGDPWLRIEHVDFAADRADLVGGALDWYEADDANARVAWHVAAIGLRDVRVTDLGGEPALHGSDHPLAREHMDTQQPLYFRGSAPCPDRGIGLLLETHRATTGGWIPFDRYLNPCCALATLLRDGYGMLAEGPSFLMRAYADCIEAEGLAPNMLAPSPARYRVGHAVRDQLEELAVFTIGSSYFVAERFEAERASGCA